MSLICSKPSNGSILLKTKTKWLTRMHNICPPGHLPDSSPVAFLIVHTTLPSISQTHEAHSWLYGFALPSTGCWCWSWSSNILATWCKQQTHWKRPWCWEREKTGEGDNRGWDDWMASLTQWTWAWESCRRWWRTGKSGVLQSMGWQRVGHDLVTEKQQQQSYFDFSSTLSICLEEAFCGKAANWQSWKEIQTPLPVWLVEMERKQCWNFQSPRKDWVGLQR